MNRLTRIAAHASLFRTALVWAARARRGRFGNRVETPIHAAWRVAPPFFIVGSGRSGNTLLRAMITAHPDLAIPPESYVLREVVWLGKVFRDDRWPRQVDRLLARFDTPQIMDRWTLDLETVRSQLLEAPPEGRGVDALVDAVYRDYMARFDPDASRWGDKTPINALYLPWLDDLFPEALWIHMLRDGRDAAVSFVRAGLHDDLLEAADRWVESVRHVRRFARHVPPTRFLEVRYEELVRESRAVLERVCAFLGIGLHERMLEHWHTAAVLGDVDLPHLRRVAEPLTRDRVGLWQGLAPRERRRLEGVLNPTLREFGYR